MTTEWWLVVMFIVFFIGFFIGIIAQKQRIYTAHRSDHPKCLRFTIYDGDVWKLTKMEQ